MLLVLFYRYASYLLLQLPIFPFKVSLHLWEEQKEISSEILQGGSDLPAPCPCLGKRLHGPGEASAVRGATLPKQIKSFILFFFPPDHLRAEDIATGCVSPFRGCAPAHGLEADGGSGNALKAGRWQRRGR